MAAILGVAVATVAFTLVSFGPGRVGATDEAARIKPTIARPELTVDGCVFTVKTDKEAYQPGESLTFRVEATNPTDRPVETSAFVGMTARSPALMVSRTLSPPRPQALDQHECKVSLEPRETKTITVKSKVELQAGQMIQITLSDQKQQTVVANRLNVRGDVLQQVLNQAVPAARAPAVE